MITSKHIIERSPLDAHHFEQHPAREMIERVGGQVRNHPWPSLLGAVLLGVALGSIWHRPKTARDLVEEQLAQASHALSNSAERLARVLKFW